MIDVVLRPFKLPVRIADRLIAQPIKAMSSYFEHTAPGATFKQKIFVDTDEDLTSRSIDLLVGDDIGQKVRERLQSHEVVIAVIVLNTQQSQMDLDLQKIQESVIARFTTPVLPLSATIHSQSSKDEGWPVIVLTVQQNEI